MAEPLKWYDEKAGSSPWIDALAELRQRPRVKATAINTFRRSRLRLTSTQRRRWATGITFSISPMASASLTTLAIEPAGSCWRAFFG